VFKGAYVVNSNSGGTFLNFPVTGSSHWIIKNLVIKNHRYAARMRLAGTTYTVRTHLTFENIVCESVEDGFGIYNSSRITLKNCTVTRHTKKAFRVSDYSQHIILEGCYADCNGGDDNFPAAAIPTGFCCDDTEGLPIIHDISFIDCVARNNRYKQSSSSYWNGDGFSSERGTYNLLFLRCEGYDNHDGGFDNKASNITYIGCVSAGNKTGYRHWGPGAVMENCIAANNAKWGGSSSSYSLWVSESDGGITVRNSTFHHSSNASQEVVVNSGGNGSATLTNCLLSSSSPTSSFYSNAVLVDCVTVKPGAGDDPQFVAASAGWRGMPADAMDSRLYGTEKAYNSAAAGRPANSVPSLSITAQPASGDAPLVVRFTADAADDDGVIAGYSWSFGNGQSSFEQNPTVTFGEAGEYVVICTVTDNRGAMSARTVQVAVGAPSMPVPIRIEAGGAASLIDSKGNPWAADYGYGAGGGATDRGAIEIAGTDDDRIYQTERWGVSNYTFLLANGVYTVRLHFAETYLAAAGLRLFSITANGAIPAGWSDIDVFAQAGGGKTALIKEGALRITDNILSLDFAARLDSAMINGIEIIPDAAGAGDIPPTAPSNLAAASIGVNSLDLSWTASEDDIGVTGYEVFLNGVSRGVFPGTAAALAGLNPFTSYTVTVRARDAAGNASAASAPLVVKTAADPGVPLDIIIDNADAAGVSITGAWSSLTTTPGYLGGDYLSDGNADKGAKSVRFTPDIPFAQPLTVYLRWTSGPNRAAAVPVDITHADGTGTVIVDQRERGGEWVPLGTWYFDTGTGANVLLRTTNTAGFVMADAVRFMKAAPDTEPPTAPTGLSFADVTGSGFTLAWTGATDNIGVARYEILVNGAPHAVAGGTSAIVTGLAGETAYSITVRALDAFGNASAESEPLAVTTAETPPAPPGAGVISLNFAGVSATDAGPNNLIVGDLVGAVPAAYWNNHANNATSRSGIRDSRGEAVATTFSLGGVGFGHTNSTPELPAPMTDDAKMMRSMRGGASAASTMTMIASQVPYPAYDIYVYWGGRSSSEAVPFTMSVAFQLQDAAGAWVTQETRYIRDTDRKWDGIYTESAATTEEAAVDGGNYVVFRNVTRNNFRLVGPNSVRNGFCGVQIVARGDGAPIIYTQPRPAGAIVGGTLTLHAGAVGDDLVWQWFRDGAPIDGATAPVLTLADAQIADSGAYTVAVTNAAGSVISQPAAVTVLPPLAPPEITVQPQSVQAEAGGTATFSVTASGDSLAYQWRRNGEPLPGATDATLVLAGVQPADMAAYSVVVSNPAGSVPSQAAALSVVGAGGAPLILVQPRAVDVNAGGNASFVVLASGTGLSYQWTLDGAPLSGATAAKLQLTGIQESNTGAYAVTVTNGNGSATSEPAALAIIDGGVADVISLNFTKAGALLAATDVAGVVPAANWNNATTSGGGANPAIDGTGAATTAILSSGNTNYDYTNDTPVMAAPLDDDAIMMSTQRGLSNTNGAMSATATRIPWPVYDVYAYWGGRANGQAIPQNMAISFQLQDGTGAYVTRETKYLRDTDRKWDGIYSESLATTADEANGATDADYVVFRDVTAPAFRLAINAMSRGGLTGLQIVKSRGQPPAITTQPEGAGVALGADVTFSVAATGPGALSYQWHHDNTPVAGATAGTLTITNAAPSDVGAYTVTVSNLYGSDTSQPAVLNLLPAPGSPAITDQPRDTQADTGGAATFSVTATGDDLVYQWARDGVPIDGIPIDGALIDGATSAVLTLSSVTLADAGVYTVTVRNTLGAVTSQPAVLTVINTNPPAITAQPQGAGLDTGSSIALTAATTDDAGNTYQWYHDGVAIPGATAATLTLDDIQPADAGLYTVEITNAHGTTASESATIAVSQPGVAGMYYATPAGAGAKDGSSWGNALAAAGIQAKVTALLPGEILHLGSGAYTGTLAISGEGAPGSPKCIHGVDTGGGLPVFQGTHVLASNSGGTFLNFGTATCAYWTIKNLVVRKHRYVARMSVSGATYTLRSHITLENIHCDSVEDGFGTANASNITIKDCSVIRYTKKAYRISDYSRFVTFDGCLADCNMGDDSFPAQAIPTGFGGDDTAGAAIIHDISFIDCVARNNRYAQADENYWNGDGFTSERGTYNLLFLRCVSYDNHDGGFDNKADDITYRDCISAGNKKGYRHWAARGIMYNCVAANNAKWGGSSSATSVWVSGAGGELDIHFSTFHNAANTQVEVESGGTARCVISDSIISTDNPAGAFTSGPAELVRTATFRPGAGDDPRYIAPATGWRGTPADAMDSQLHGAAKGYNSGATGADTTPPAVPSGLVATGITRTGFTLSWTASTDDIGVAGYQVFIDGAPHATTAATTLDITGLVIGTGYTVTVAARDLDSNWSAQSAPLTVSTLALTPPPAPANLQAIPGDKQVRLTWSASADAVSYNIKRSVTDGAGYTTIATTATPGYTDTALTGGVTCHYVVSAENTAGESPDSAQASATPADVVYTLVKAINLAGPAVTIDGATWLSHDAALADGLAITGAVPVTTTAAWTPAPDDADTATMLNTALQGATGFSLDQTIENGAYRLYFWLAEPDSAAARKCNISLENADAATDIGALPLNGWQKYGPFDVIVSDGVLNIDFVRRAGTPLCAGLEIHRADGAPVITTHPQSTTAITGETVTLAITATGDNLACQWTLGGTPIPNATATTLTLAAATPADSGLYRVIVSNPIGSVTSLSANLTVRDSAPVITTQPADTTGDIGGSASFSVTAIGGGGGFTYQWMFNTAPIENATNATLTLDNLQPAHAGSYAVTITNTLGTTTSATAALAIQGNAPGSIAPLVPTQPIAAGRPVNLTAFAQGNPAPTYQWMFSTDGGQTWQPVADSATHAGAQTASLTILAATAQMNGWQYRCVAANDYGETTSTASTLAVTPALFSSPAALVLDTAGNIYVADSAHHTLHTIAAGGTTALLAGSTDTSGTLDGTGTAARFNTPAGLAIISGTLLVADTGNALIRAVTAAGSASTLIAAPAGLASPSGIAAAADGNFYIADTAAHVIRRRAPDGALTVLAGAPGFPGALDATGAAARFNHPTGIALGGDGHLYIADTGNHTLRRLAPDSGIVTTLAGPLDPAQPGSTDATSAAARFNHPEGLVTTGAGPALRVYVADTGNSVIREITPDGHVSTLAGYAGEDDIPGVPGFKDGVGTDAWFNAPRDIAVDTSGNLYVADTGNGVIRKITPDNTVSTLTLIEYTTPPPAPPPPDYPKSGGSGGSGGGAPSPWLFAALAALAAARALAPLRKPPR
jgi:chitodextrinase